MAEQRRKKKKKSLSCVCQRKRRKIKIVVRLAIFSLAARRNGRSAMSCRKGRVLKLKQTEAERDGWTPFWPSAANGRAKMTAFFFSLRIGRQERWQGKTAKEKQEEEDSGRWGGTSTGRKKELDKDAGGKLMLIVYGKARRTASRFPGWRDGGGSASWMEPRVAPMATSSKIEPVFAVFFLPEPQPHPKHMGLIGGAAPPALGQCAGGKCIYL